MTMPFYVAPEQLMKDRAEYAQKGIARAKSLVAVTYLDGILIAAENPSKSLHKISEVYDRIAFAGAGKYNEFDQLRVAGIRHADTKGFAYSREDVNARSLANLYAQYLGEIFTHETKPMEIEILVAELAQANNEDSQDKIYHILYDGTLMDEDHFTVLGGDVPSVAGRLTKAWKQRWSLKEALGSCLYALGGDSRVIPDSELEVAVLSHTNGRRAFKRIVDDELKSLRQNQLKPGKSNKSAKTSPA
ncbi:MAG: proteasome subunit alpha [Actinobacteria bacterium]|nr:proteasome subunit alpha [Actinomycetota bacterium]MCL6105710.1 proteasome subunit alpha [Actinomycetota bacterium]